MGVRRTRLAVQTVRVLAINAKQRVCRLDEGLGGQMITSVRESGSDESASG
jgi:hypothetical protein